MNFTGLKNWFENEADDDDLIQIAVAYGQDNYYDDFELTTNRSDWYGHFADPSLSDAENAEKWAWQTSDVPEDCDYFRLDGNGNLEGVHEEDLIHEIQHTFHDSILRWLKDDPTSYSFLPDALEEFYSEEDPLGFLADENFTVTWEDLGIGKSEAAKANGIHDFAVTVAETYGDRAANFTCQCDPGVADPGRAFFLTQIFTTIDEAIALGEVDPEEYDNLCDMISEYGDTAYGYDAEQLQSYFYELLHDPTAMNEVLFTFDYVPECYGYVLENNQSLERALNYFNGITREPRAVVIEHPSIILAENKPMPMDFLDHIKHELGIANIASLKLAGYANEAGIEAVCLVDRNYDTYYAVLSHDLDVLPDPQKLDELDYMQTTYAPVSSTLFYKAQGEIRHEAPDFSRLSTFHPLSYEVDRYFIEQDAASAIEALPDRSVSGKTAETKDVCENDRSADSSTPEKQHTTLSR